MKTSLIVTLSATVVAILALVTVLIVQDKEITPFLLAVAAVVPAVGALYGIKQLGAKVDTVTRNTNGTLSARDATIASQQLEISTLRSLLSPSQALSVEAHIASQTGAESLTHA